MSTTTDEPRGQELGIEAGELRPHLRESTIVELYELHARTQAIAKEVGPFSRPAARRKLRDAKAAETDLMRVLGFDSWEDFVRATGGPRELPEEPPPADAATDVETAVAGLGAELLEELTGTRAELRALRSELATVGEELEAATLEIVALRLELVVLARRAR